MTKDRDPDISICVITYNAVRTIGRCLESIFDQDYPHGRMEVLVIDAGSSDETTKVAKEFHGTRLIVEKGATRGRARNMCIREARAGIVAITRG